MFLRPLSQLESQAVSWLWPGRLALGKLAMLDGDPGLGKSLLTLDLCARLSSGRPMPDGSPGSDKKQGGRSLYRGGSIRPGGGGAALRLAAPGPAPAHDERVRSGTVVGAAAREVPALHAPGRLLRELTTEAQRHREESREKSTRGEDPAVTRLPCHPTSSLSSSLCLCASVVSPSPGILS